MPVACTEPSPAPQPPSPPVTVARPVQREVIEWDEYTGRLTAAEIVEVRPRVSGFITEAPFAEGSLVKAGDLLFVIDERPFQAELARARAELGEAEATRDYAATEFQRIERLRPTGSASETEYTQAVQALRRAEATVAAARANVDKAALDVEWCRVTAAIDGRVSNRYVTPGNLVSGGGAQGQGTLLTTITRTSPIHCFIDADEQSVLKYQELSRTRARVSARDARIPAVLGLASEREFRYEGVIDFVDNRVDPMTGTLRARAVFDNADGYLLPGFFARVRIPGSGRYTALLVPDAAVGADQDQRFLLVVNAEDKVERRGVKLGAEFGRFRAIASGITADDRVIINGLQRARPGVTVAVRETPLSTDEIDKAVAVAATTRQWLATQPATAPTTSPAAATTAPTTAPAGAAGRAHTATTAELTFGYGGEQ